MPLSLTRRRLLAGLGLLPAAPLMAQATASRIGQFDLGSPDQGWRILTAAPHSPPPPGGYAAIIALDGAKTLPLLRDLRDQMAPDAPVMLAGITYPGAGRRWQDLTSPALITMSGQEGHWRAAPGTVTGGRRAFLQMIETRLVPTLQRDHGVNPAQLTLLGHSLGGLFTFHALFARPDLFARYVAADPSVWWNYGEVPREAAAFAGGIRAAGGRMDPPRDLVITRAGDMGKGGRIGGRPIDPMLLNVLERIDGLRVDYQLYPDHNHGSVLIPSARRALELQPALRAR